MVDFIKEKVRAAQDLMSPDSSSGPQITDEAHVQAGRKVPEELQQTKTVAELAEKALENHQEPLHFRSLWILKTHAKI
jgi:hypothetical protein